MHAHLLSASPRTPSVGHTEEDMTEETDLERTYRAVTASATRLLDISNEDLLETAVATNDPGVALDIIQVATYVRDSIGLDCPKGHICANYAIHAQAKIISQRTEIERLQARLIIATTALASMVGTDRVGTAEVAGDAITQMSEVE